MNDGGLPPIQRPDGRLYRPRKIIAGAIRNQYDDLLGGVIVYGTHDIERATRLAQEFVDWQLGRGYAPVNPQAGWWRDTFSSGQRTLDWSEKHGRGAVMFDEIAEVTR